MVEKAISPVDGRVTWLVLDDNLDPVDEVTQFALYLDGGGASLNLNPWIDPRRTFGGPDQLVLTLS